MANLIFTPRGLLSYPNIIDPQVNDTTGYTQFNGQVIVPKEKSIKHIQDALKACMAENLSKLGLKTMPEKLPANLTWPVKNGDDPKFEDKPEYHGCWVIKAGSKQKPGVLRLIGVNADGSPKTEKLEDTSLLYAGCEVIFNVNPYAYCLKDKTGKGMSLGLQAVLITDSTLPAFSGRVSADEAFNRPIDDLPDIADVDGADFTEAAQTAAEGEANDLDDDIPF